MGTMNKEVQVVVQGVKLNVLVTDDFTVKGSFDPDAACPEEYFGYRETEFEVLSGRFFSQAYSRQIEMLHDDLDDFLDENCLDVEAAIQEQLDKDREDQYVDLSGCTVK